MIQKGHLYYWKRIWWSGTVEFLGKAELIREDRQGVYLQLLASSWHTISNSNSVQEFKISDLQELKRVKKEELPLYLYLCSKTALFEAYLKGSL